MNTGPPQDAARNPSSPFLREALTILDPLDLGIPLLQGLVETKTARTSTASLSGEGALVPLNDCNRCKGGGLAGGAGVALQ